MSLLDLVFQSCSLLVTGYALLFSKSCTCALPLPDTWILSTPWLFSTCCLLFTSSACSLLLWIPKKYNEWGWRRWMTRCWLFCTTQKLLFWAGLVKEGTPAQENQHSHFFFLQCSTCIFRNKNHRPERSTVLEVFSKLRRWHDLECISIDFQSFYL